MDDDDFGFGASVWASSSNTAPPQREDASVFSSSTKISSLTDDAFDDDDFNVPVDSTTEDDDDFGDFGDFGEVDPGSSMAFGGSVNFDDVRIPGPSSQNWRPLLLDPFPSRSSLESEINETLGPIWRYEDITHVTTDEPIREAEGVAQILITPSRCVL